MPSSNLDPSKNGKEFEWAYLCLWDPSREIIRIFRKRIAPKNRTRESLQLFQGAAKGAKDTLRTAPSTPRELLESCPAYLKYLKGALRAPKAARNQRVPRLGLVLESPWHAFVDLFSAPGPLFCHSGPSFGSSESILEAFRLR